MVTGLLAVVSIFIFPDWIWSFLRSVTAGWRMDYGFTPAGILTQLGAPYPVYLGWGMTGLLVIVLLVEWSSARRAEERRFFWTACLTLAVTPLIGFRNEMENLVILFLPMMLIFSVVRERWRAGYFLSSLLLMIILLVPWGIVFLPDASVPVKNGLLYLFLPGFTLICLYWIRWWTLRPPRTWLDRVASQEYQ
jgi:hypothetical protein